MAEKPLWSVVVIAKNEEKTLPRLVASLKEFQERGGEILVVDTGSTDQTIEIAKRLGCRVEGIAGTCELSEEQARVINMRFCRGGEADIVKPRYRYFDFAGARNFAASLAASYMVAMPDCDEIYTRLDIDAINASIRAGYQQLEYPFIFSHFLDGSPQIAFTHCKFYDRRILEWQGIVHEVLVGDAKKTFLPDSVIRLEHYQNQETKRGQYLTGLALDCLQNPDNDRNSHYIARELMWSGRYQSAIDEFLRHINMDKWPQERAQSQIYIGDCQLALGHEDLALACWLRSFLVMDPTRRAGLMAAATHYWKKNDAPRTAALAAAALTVPLNSYYGNDMADYTWRPHEILYWALWQTGDKFESERHWQNALAFRPEHTKYLHDARFYMALPKVSIVIPSLGREEQLEKCRRLIQENANYPDFEVIVEKSTFENRKTCPVAFKHGLRRATGKLVMFLGNDCEPQPNFLIQAVLKFYDAFDSFEAPGLVALNDGHWDGKLATHWLASRSLQTQLSCSGNPEGDYFYTGYHHVGADNELTGVCKQGRWYAYAPLARVIHNTAAQGDPGTQPDAVSQLAWQPDLVSADRKLLEKRAVDMGFEVV